MHTQTGGRSIKQVKNNFKNTQNVTKYSIFDRLVAEFSQKTKKRNGVIKKRGQHVYIHCCNLNRQFSTHAVHTVLGRNHANAHQFVLVLENVHTVQTKHRTLPNYADKEEVATVN